MDKEKQLGHFEHLDQWAAKQDPNEWTNPMVRKFGKGKDGLKCGSCTHFVRVDGGSKKYLKCQLRGITRGAGTDHRAKWRACAKYEINPQGSPRLGVHE